MLWMQLNRMYFKNTFSVPKVGCLLVNDSLVEILHLQYLYTNTIQNCKTKCFSILILVNYAHGVWVLVAIFLFWKLCTNWSSSLIVCFNTAIVTERLSKLKDILWGSQFLFPSLYIYIYIYIYIYCHPQTDCFVLSELFSVARHAGRSKPVLKPIQLYVRLSLRPLDQQADYFG